MHREYLKALKVIKSYEEQMEKSSVKVSDLSINQKVKRNYPESWFYWVSEIVGEDVLLRTTEKEEDPECDDFMVNVSEIRLDLS
jgi:hypothetical protein